MKKRILLLALILSVASNVFAEEVEIDGLWYNLSETTAEVIMYKNDVKYSGDIVIPSTVNYNDTEFSVTSIGENAFYYCAYLASVSIPNSVHTIGDWAFACCYSLTSVTIPSSVITIGYGAFRESSGLTSIIIPNSVNNIGNSAFFYCSSLTSITIPSNVTSIGDEVFGHCSGLTSITIPSSVTSISSSAFQYCSSLTSINVEVGNTKYDSRENCNAIIETESNILIAGCQNTIIPSNVTGIGVMAFCGCSNLSSIVIPNSVTYIEGSAFWECSGLSSITIPNSVTRINRCTFYGCSGLTSITIPNSVTFIGDGAIEKCTDLTIINVEEGNTRYDSRDNCNAIIETSSNTLIAGCKNTTIPSSVTTIGSNAFFECYGLSSIAIPNNITTIKNGAFRYCRGLTSVTIPSSVTSIEEYAFNSCTSLSSITIPNSVTNIGESVFSECRSLTSITIPSNVTSIGKYAFFGCSGLTYITIPYSVKSIGGRAFQDCYGLTDVYCYAETVPTTESNVFSDTPISNITLHVPTASIEAYKTTEPWSGFKEIVESDYLDVADLNIKAGESNTQEISLNNGLTDLVAFQMDLTLPEGVGIDKTGCTLSSRITDNEQELKIGKLESGAYRFTSTSLSLTPISGNDGTLLNLKLTAEDGCIGGQATISNIIFSTAESEKVIMSDKTFDISVLYNLTYKVDGEEYKTSSVAYGTALTAEAEPTKEGYTFGGWSELPETMPNHDVEITGRFYLYGDVNTDEAVDVVDVVDIARFVVATPSVSFRVKLADLNFDNTVNIADAVTLVNYIAGDQNFARAMESSKPYNYDQCQLQLLNNGTSALSFHLSGESDFTAFQFDVKLPENTDITAMRINGQRMNSHQLLYNKVADNRYRVAALSLSNAVFKGNEGELLSISIDGQSTEEINVDNILFVTKNSTGITFNALSLSEATGIANVHVNEGNNTIYDLQGRKLSKVLRGVNIVDGKKVVVK